MNLYAFCSHCGRTLDICGRLGSDDCQEARKRFFDEQRKSLEYLSEQWKKRRSAALCESKEKP